MSDEQVLDPRVSAWLHDGPTTASDWVSRMVIDHARDHPRHAPVGVRGGKLIKDLLAGRPAVVSRRLAIALAAATLLVALAGAGYLAWRQNVVVPPVPTSTPTASPSPTAQFECPPGTNPDEPGPADQARPARESYADWYVAREHGSRAAVDAHSRQLVLVSRGVVWAFDLCTNTWRETASTVADARAPVYDPVADRIVFVEPAEVVTYDVDTDRVTPAGDTPVVGRWNVDYDSARRLIVARDERTSRVWTYDLHADTWREITQTGDVPPPAEECDDSWGEQVMTYDASRDRLVLYYPTSACHGVGPNTYELALSTGTWQRQPEVAPHFGAFDWTGPLLQMAYDEAGQRSVLYSVDRLGTYDAARHVWADAFVTPAARGSGDYNHTRVPVVYDPINRRTVLVGSDLLGRAGPGWQGWMRSNDVTAIDLATMTVTELLAEDPSASATAVVDTLPDPVGDGGEADIGRVSTVATENTLTLRIELQGGFGPDTLRREGHPDVRLAIYWNADNRRPPGASGWGATCEPWLATYRTFIGPDGGIEARYYEPVDQQVDIGEGLVTLRLSLASFDTPQAIGYAVSTGSDWAPDYVELPGCHWVPLVTGS